MNKSLTILLIPDNGERTYEFKYRVTCFIVISFSVILLGFGLNEFIRLRLQNQITA